MREDGHGEPVYTVDEAAGIIRDALADVRSGMILRALTFKVELDAPEDELEMLAELPPSFRISLIPQFEYTMGKPPKYDHTYFVLFNTAPSP